MYILHSFQGLTIMGNQKEAGAMKKYGHPFEKKDADDYNIKCCKQFVETLEEQKILEAQLCCKFCHEWIYKSDGKYTEIDEKEFYPTCKESPKMVVHFYSRDVPRCTIWDHHLQILAAGHFEAKFVKINAEYATDLTEKLRIWSFPTLIIIIDGDFKEYICSISGRENETNFSTEILERRLVATGIIKYGGDYPQELDNSENQGQHKKNNRKYKNSDESD